MTTLTCMRGYPGSGKSVAARSIPGVVVGRDYLRKQLFGQYQITNDDEALVTIAERAQVTALLSTGHSVVIDDMNLNGRYLKNWAKVARDHGAEFAVHDVPTSAETCIRRDTNKQRLDDGKAVGEAVILKLAKKFPIAKWPTVVIKPKPTTKLVPYVAKPGLDKAIIVDIDGTLAHMVEGGRSPYDYSRVSEDVVDPIIRDLVNRQHVNGNAVLVCSGRDSSCRKATIQWLNDNNVYWTELFMRPEEAKDDEGNKLPDWIVKAELFDTYIRHCYDVRYVLDDRQQVVDMWRALGLKCLQVEPGNF